MPYHFLLVYPHKFFCQLGLPNKYLTYLHSQLASYTRNKSIDSLNYVFENLGNKRYLRCIEKCTLYYKKIQRDTKNFISDKKGKRSKHECKEAFFTLKLPHRPVMLHATNFRVTEKIQLGVKKFSKERNVLHCQGIVKTINLPHIIILSSAKCITKQILVIEIEEKILF